MVKELDLSAIRELLTDEIDAASLAAIVEEVMFTYIDSVITNAHQVIPGTAESGNIFYMRLLRDAIRQSGHPGTDAE